MATITSSPSPKKSAAEYKRIVEELFAEMDKIEARMARNQIEIDCLKAESARQEAETRAILDRLKAKF
jgi:hypothetical protein